MKYLISTSPGLEEENIKEIVELTQRRAQLQAGGILELEAEMKDIYRILCGSFLSSRVLMPLASFHAWEKEVLYTEIKKIPWHTLIQEGETFVCDVHGRPDECDYSAMQGLLKVKDAIVDQIREKRGSRPDVDKENPTHQIEVFFWKGKTEISIDLCGEPMHRRNYRKLRGTAPLRESRAAALIRLSGIRENIPTTLYDPFCGSGTIAIETALMLRKIPPANRRPVPKKSFIAKFQKEYLEVLTELRSAILPKCPVQIIASDIDSSIIPKAQRSAETAEVLGDIHFEVKSFENQSFQRGGSAVLISNPPFGERLEDEYEAREIIKALGRKVKFQSDIEQMTLLVPKGMETDAGLKPSHKSRWKAAELDLVAATYHLWKGSKKKIDAPSL